MKLNKLGLKEIIKKEVEAILANEKIEESFDIDPAAFLDEMMDEAEGKGCAESEGGPGCIKKQDDQWVIMNNKKGGVWRKCDSEAHCEEILDAFHASKG